VRRKRAPRPLSEAVSAARGKAEPATLLAAVQSAWPGAVGEAIASQASPVAERSGVVTLSCRSSTWAHELDLLGDEILVKIRQNLPQGNALEGLRFTASGEPGGVFT
jgi:predicted nucleic acid-binding Zn ribbon protein